MRRLPKVGERVKVKGVGKGKIMFIGMNELTSIHRDIWPAIQVWLDKPHDSAPTWRAHKEELVILKKDPRARRLAELKKKYEKLRRK